METYDVEFQRGLVAALWASPAKLANVGKDLPPAFFSEELVAGVYTCLLDHFNKYRVLPDLGAISEELKEYVQRGRKWGEYLEEARNIHSRIKGDHTYYLSKATDFVRKAALEEALYDSRGLIEQGKLDDVASRMQKAFRVGSVGEDQYYDLLGSLDERVKQYEEGDKEDRAKRIPCGIGPIDDAIRGGFGPGELAIVLVLAKSGKSTTLVNFGANALLAGKGVLHISLENNRRIVAERYDTRLFGKPVGLLYGGKSEAFKSAMKTLREKLTKSLEIMYFPNGTLTLPQLSTVIAGAKNPDLVIIDFADYMRMPGDGDLRHKLSDLYKGVRQIAVEHQVPILTASQANRPAFDRKIVGMENFAECFEKAGIMDMGISMSYSPEENLIDNKVTLTLIGNRIGKSGVKVDCRVNWETATIKADLEDIS